MFSPMFLLSPVPIGSLTNLQPIVIIIYKQTDDIFTDDEEGEEDEGEGEEDEGE